MNIIEITKYSDEVLEVINDLLPQLSAYALPLSISDLTKIIQSESSHLLMAKKEDDYCGTLTLVTFKIPTGTKAWIEDLVVNESCRGKGVGRLLIEHAIALAKTLNANTIDLTSNRSRTAANILYEKMGFKHRKTNIYRYSHVKQL